MAKKKVKTVKVEVKKTQMVEVNGRDIVFHPGDELEVSIDTARIWTSRGYAELIKE